MGRILPTADSLHFPSTGGGGGGTGPVLPDGVECSLTGVLTIPGSAVIVNVAVSAVVINEHSLYVGATIV